MKTRLLVALLAAAFLTPAFSPILGQEQNSPKAATAADSQELAKLEGDWKRVQPEGSSVPIPAPLREQKTTIKGDQWTMVTPRPDQTASSVSTLKIKLNPSTDPKSIEQFAPTGSSRVGIYKLEGDTLTLCFDRDTKKRPTDFTAGGTQTLTVFQRVGPASATPAPTPIAQASQMPADLKAYSEAMRMAEPEKKLEALQKFSGEFPESRAGSSVRREVVRTLLQMHRNQHDKLLAGIKSAVAAAPGTAKPDIYLFAASELLDAGILLDEAEEFAKESCVLTDQQRNLDAQRKVAPRSALGRIYLKQGNKAEAEKLLKGVLEDYPASPLAAAALGDLSQSNGDEKSALDYFAAAMLAGPAPAGTRGKLESLFAKLHKDVDPVTGLERMLDERYRKSYPPLPVAHYSATPERSNRVVLAEVFTGTACPPCVAADVAFDAMLERYSRQDLVVLMYHLHIPAPDPLTNPSTVARGKFYGIRGVPSYVLDGEQKTGGGSRDMAQGFFDRVNPTIEQRLEQAAEASLAVRAAIEGTKVKVNAEVSQLRPDAAHVKLQIALVEELLSYSGENGIRLHPVVVRSLAGEDAGGITIDAAKPAPVEHVFDIAAISAELKGYLDGYEAAAPGGRKFSQKKHAIDGGKLAVAAFLQDQKTKKILQAAYVDITP